MPASRVLGDAHNFGRRVSRRKDRIAKPRTLYWEWLLLSGESPLRRLLHEEGGRALGSDAFGFLPDLKFFPRDPRRAREVSAVDLAPLPALSRKGRHALATIVGRAVALFSWLGLSDLHWENLVLGRDASGRTIFAPLDVEMILADLAMPTDTKLLPDPDPEYAEICRHAAGVRRVLPYLKKPIDPADLVAMASAYLRALAFLEGQRKAIAAVFTELPGIFEAPIRVLLRGTGEYVGARSEPIWPPLLEGESEQLARGDIPYFFRLYGQAGIHYYGNRALSLRKTLPMKGDVPQLDPLLRVAQALRSPARKKLREEGLFAVLGAFDHASFRGPHTSDGLTVTFGARALIVKAEEGEELHARRDLRAFVGSVYLPCRCGEVRTVFVPEVTACRMSGTTLDV